LHRLAGKFLATRAGGIGAAEFAHRMEGVPLMRLGAVGGRSLHLRRGQRRTSPSLRAMRTAWADTLPKQVVVS